jgi:predicted DNA-binding protein
MRATRSVVISMRLPAESGKRLKRMANRHGWTPSDASARLVEEGLRRSEFAFSSNLARGANPFSFN